MISCISGRFVYRLSHQGKQWGHNQMGIKPAVTSKHFLEIRNSFHPNLCIRLSLEQFSNSLNFKTWHVKWQVGSSACSENESFSKGQLAKLGLRNFCNRMMLIIFNSLENPEESIYAFIVWLLTSLLAFLLFKVLPLRLHTVLHSLSASCWTLMP